MRPHPILVYTATGVAVVSLVAGGRELALRFAPGTSVVDLVGPILAVVTAVICIVVLDWARNLPRHLGDAAVAARAEAGDAAGRRRDPAATTADERVLAGIHALEALALSENSLHAIIEAGTRTVAQCAQAIEASLWLLDPDASLRLRADYADDEVVVADGPPPDPATDADLHAVLESRTALEAGSDGRVTCLVPLVSGERCLGALRVVAAAEEPGEETEAAMRLAARLGQLAGPLARALCAPEAYEAALLDPVSGAYSLRHFHNRLTEAAGVSRRYGEPLALILLDIDNFGLLNATLGRAACDRLLREAASLFRQNVRDADSLYRSGADEFAILLPDTEAAAARVVAERLRRIFHESRTPADDGEPIIATLSGGVAEFDEDMSGFEPLVARAREALHAARGAGRDAVQLWQPPAEASTATTAG